MDKLKWETVEYPIADFAPEGKVITQRGVLEKYKAEHPNDEVKTFSSFKYNHQNRTVSLRIAIADNTPTYGGSLKSIAEDIEQAKTVEGLKNQLRCSNDVFLGSEKNYLELKAKYDTLKVENDKLQRESGTVIKLYDNVRKELAETVARNSTLKRENDRLILRLAEFELCDCDGDFCPDKIEDSADLVEAKKAIAEGGGISLDEVEDAVGDKEPVTNNDTNTVLTEAVIKRACDQAEVVGPDEDDMPEGELDDGTPDCRSDGTVPEDNENG